MLDDVTELRTFVRIVATGSLSAASREDATVAPPTRNSARILAPIKETVVRGTPSKLEGKRAAVRTISMPRSGG